MGKLADDLRPKCEHAHPDQRLEISLLGLFSYDRFSIVLREKGWILPLPSYLSKLVPESGTWYHLARRSRVIFLLHNRLVLRVPSHKLY